MDVNTITILTGTAVPVLTAVSGFAIALIHKKTAAIEQSIKHTEVDKYIKIAEDAVCTAVSSVNQICVDEKKKNGTFDQAAQEEAFNMARQKVLSIIGDAGQNMLKQAYADADAWLNDKILHYVREKKVTPAAQ